LTWHKAGAGTGTNGSYTLNFEIWWAFAASVLSSHSATVNLSGTPDGFCYGWTGITGLNTNCASRSQRCRLCVGDSPRRVRPGDAG
jgi:hypothetical protein